MACTESVWSLLSVSWYCYVSIAISSRLTFYRYARGLDGMVRTVLGFQIFLGTGLGSSKFQKLKFKFIADD